MCLLLWRVITVSRKGPKQSLRLVWGNAARPTPKRWDAWPRGPKACMEGSTTCLNSDVEGMKAFTAEVAEFDAALAKATAE